MLDIFMPGSLMMYFIVELLNQATFLEHIGNKNINTPAAEIIFNKRL